MIELLAEKLQEEEGTLEMAPLEKEGKRVAKVQTRVLRMVLAQGNVLVKRVLVREEQGSAARVKSALE